MRLVLGRLKGCKSGRSHVMKALNLYRSNGFENMAQAQRRSAFELSTLMGLFRMK